MILQPHERLRKARALHFPTAVMAAERLGIDVVNYRAMENGRNLSWLKDVNRFARAFGVSTGWLYDGTGDMKMASQPPQKRIPVVGKVKGGFDVTMTNEHADDGAWDDLDPLDSDSLMAMRIEGNSMQPRFLDGEVVLIMREAELPEHLIGKYAVVHSDKAHPMLKIIRKGSRTGRFNLQSHFGDDVEDVMIISAHRVVGVLTHSSPDARLPVPKRGR